MEWYENTDQLRSRSFAVLTYFKYAPGTKTPAVLLDLRFGTIPF